MAKNINPEDLNILLTEQRKELMTAKTLDSDLEFAYQLQLQEALTASRSLQPSISTSSPSSSQSIETQCDDVSSLAHTLMLQDVERYAQEYEDFERAEDERKKTKEDLDRRIHDQKVASEILNLPDDYWRKYGDNFEKPYGHVSSSSSSSSSSGCNLGSECLRLYFKGLVSEERIRDIKVIVAGAGIAICDPKDNLIFKATKKLEGLVGGEMLSCEAAELEALIEGLNKALDLDLKRITFFCDDAKLNQYISGRPPPGDGKISTLVNQVSLLQRKFAHCSCTLVAQGNVKDAFKLAREAIVSQINWQARSSKGKEKSLKETCVICFEDTDVSNMFSIDGCLHRYCFSCMKQHVEAKLLNGMVAKCPHEGCKSDVHIDRCREFLPPNLVDMMIQRIRESSIPVTQKVYCPIPRCSALMSKREVLDYTNASILGAEQSGMRKCVKCNYIFCINCKIPWHFNKTCNDYKRLNPNPSTEDELLKSLARQKRWRQCVKCSHMVELAYGCYHITCRCGYEFCYTCGAEWKNKKQTCSCPIWDERNLLREQQPRINVRPHLQQPQLNIQEQRPQQRQRR